MTNSTINLINGTGIIGLNTTFTGIITINISTINASIDANIGLNIAIIGNININSSSNGSNISINGIIGGINASINGNDGNIGGTDGRKIKIITK